MKRLNQLLALALMLCSVLPFQSPAQSGTYTVNGTTAGVTGQTYTSSTTDKSGVYVLNSGKLTMTNCTVSTTGNTSSNDNSSFYGLNAGILVASASTATITGCRINTTGTGANGIFSTGKETTVILENDTIVCTNDGGHGVDATYDGVMVLTNVVINTAGAHGAAISTDRGGGTITVTGGTATASGQDSPGIYSTGTITVSNSTVAGTGSEGAVIEGANKVILTNVKLSGAKGTRDRGVLMYQSMSGDATGTDGYFTMTGGSFTWPSTTGPLFYNTNSTAYITLKNVTIASSSPTLLKAGADSWGTSGSNGGHIAFSTDSQVLSGTMVADAISTLIVALQNGSSFTGAINTANTAASVALTMDGTSTWTVTGTSYLTILSNTAGISGTSVTNITGNGFNVYYDASNTANSALGGKVYTLVNGGYLAPKGTNAVGQEETSRPAKWNLNQNFPNPFNPSTTISFSTRTTEHATLMVFNLLGQPVASLFNGTAEGGKEYSLVFNASHLMSGIYFYKLQTASQSAVKKMHLVR